jgi:hypothetical protein
MCNKHTALRAEPEQPSHPVDRCSEQIVVAFDHGAGVDRGPDWNPVGDLPRHRVHRLLDPGSGGHCRLWVVEHRESAIARVLEHRSTFDATTSFTVRS